VPIGLVLVGILILVLCYRAIVPQSAADRSQLARITSWLLGGALLVLLVRSGMLWPAFVGIAVWALLGLATPIALRFGSFLRVRRIEAPQATTFEESAADARRHCPAADMTRSEALEVLGLAEGATEQEIQFAYRELIKRVHPDRGSSAHLASEVNRARDVLLSGSASTSP
jgi:hypothetical protein